MNESKIETLDKIIRLIADSKEKSILIRNVHESKTDIELIRILVNRIADMSKEEPQEFNIGKVQRAYPKRTPDIGFNTFRTTGVNETIPVTCNGDTLYE